MPENQELMALMGGAGKTGGAAPSEPVDPAAAPLTAPQTTPQPNEGEQQEAMVSIAMAMDLMESALVAFGSESEQGKALLSSLSGLSKSFGQKRDKGKQMVPAELMMMMQKLPQAGGASPEMKAMGAPPPGAGAPPPMQQRA